jgi:glucose/arabinose dehydrogenase
VRGWSNIVVGAVTVGLFAMASRGDDVPAADGKSGGAPELKEFQVRAGYVVSVAVEDVPGARFLAVGAQGELYVSRPRERDILRFAEPNAEGVFTKRTEFAKNFAGVHGLSVQQGVLWFATSGTIHRATDGDNDGVAELVVDVIGSGRLPRGGGHWWRSLLVTDDVFYTSIGDAGNITDQRDTDRQKIWRFRHDGTERTLIASGIRNTEKLLLRPGTREVWGFDHGSDWFGKKAGDVEGNQPITDLNPPDELNKYVEGGFYGHPFIVGDRMPRLEYLDHPEIHELAGKTTAPEWSVAAHSATNGFCFIAPELSGAGKFMPADHAGDVMVACHGSWNATRKAGYSVLRILFDQGKPYGSLPIVVTMTKDGERVLARPVDCVQAPDGSVLFSSDAPGRVYRIRHVGHEGK